MMTQVTDTSPAGSRWIILLQEWDLELDIAVSSDALAPNVATPSAATVLTTKTWFCKSFMFINEFQ